MVGRPRTYVPSPTFTPLPYGLLSTLMGDVRTPSDNHWQLGVNYRSVCAEGGTTYGSCFAITGTGASVGAPPDKTATTEIAERGATAFTVYTRVDCSAPGFWDDAVRIVGDALTQSEQWQVENALWTGMAGGQPVVMPHLAEDVEYVDSSGIILQTAATPVSGISGALDIVEALGGLESALADCYDGVGVIHAPRVLLSAFASEGLITKVGGRYITVGGNTIVFGSGYPGTSPSGTSSFGSVWMYATGSMFIYRSAAQVMPLQESINRATNTVEALAERTYVIGWDCCHLAVNVSTGGVITGTPTAP